VLPGIRLTWLPHRPHPKRSQSAPIKQEVHSLGHKRQPVAAAATTPARWQENSLTMILASGLRRFMPFPAPTFQFQSEGYGPMLGGSNARRRLMRSHAGNCPLMTPKYNRNGKQAYDLPAILRWSRLSLGTNSGVPGTGKTASNREGTIGTLSIGLDTC
jgi:hypothetical protein